MQKQTMPMLQRTQQQTTTTTETTPAASNPSPKNAKSTKSQKQKDNNSTTKTPNKPSILSRASLQNMLPTTTTTATAVETPPISVDMQNNVMCSLGVYQKKKNYTHLSCIYSLLFYKSNNHLIIKKPQRPVKKMYQSNQVQWHG